VRKPIASHAKVFRCAIYTRKSSEEGLEQDFNSLHAQRESCDAYIKSQRHEGWTPFPPSTMTADIPGIDGTAGSQKVAGRYPIRPD
jgi:hypothetical protein